MKETEERVLVLGSAGFIGSALCARLAGMDRPVLALGRSERTGIDGCITYLRGSIDDRHLLREAMAACRTLVYAASISTPATTAADPALEVIGNLLPFSRVLECAAEFPGRHLIYLSSGGTIYGDRATDATEDFPLRPRSYYGAGKAAAEAMLHACVATGDWSATVLRPSNLYGPGQPVSKGFAIVPTLFDRASDGKPFQIWGDGSIVRDYCYIDDLTRAIVAATTAAPRNRFNVYNVASGRTTSILELVKACELASGRHIDIEFKPLRGVDVASVSPNAKAIQMDLGWSAEVELATGLRRTWDWRLRAARAT